LGAHIFNPSFAQNQPCTTPQNQWNSSLPIQWCLLDPYGRIRVVSSCLLCPWGCQWPQKLCWLLQGPSHLKPQFYDFGQPNMLLAQWRWQMSPQQSYMYAMEKCTFFLSHIVHLCWLFMYYHNQLYESMSWLPRFCSCTIHITPTSCLWYHTTNSHVRHVAAMAGTSICTHIGISFGSVLKDLISRHLSKTRTFMTSPSVSLAIPTQHSWPIVL
jgi:hypothetical protein